MAQRTSLNRPYGLKHEDDIVRDITDLYTRTGGSTGYVSETYEIGDWNMDSNTYKTVSYTTTQTGAPVAISGVIRNDSGFYYPIHATDIGSDGTTTEASVNISSFGSGNIYMVRKTGSSFDGTQFDSTGYNRGWITITYLAS